MQGLGVCLFANNNHPVDTCFHFIVSLKFLEIYNFFCDCFVINDSMCPHIVTVTRKSSMYIVMKTPMLPLARIRVLLHLRVDLILYKIPKRTSQKLEGPWRVLLSIITCIYDCWQWTSQGEEAIRLAVALHKKIEEKAVPIRTWLVCHL